MEKRRLVHLKLNSIISSFLLSEQGQQELKQRTSFYHQKTARFPGKQTSENEYAVDALALEAEEGRGDRRNVQGELHAS